MVRLNGASRSIPDLRNNPALLKPLDKIQHQRIHGRGGGQARYDPFRRVWYGTTEAMKTVPTGLLGYTISTAENANRASPGRARPSATPQRTPREK